MQYNNSVYNPCIQIAMLYNRSKQNSLPVITLNSFDQLLLCINDLTGGIKNHCFSVELCYAFQNLTNLPVYFFRIAALSKIAKPLYKIV